MSKLYRKVSAILKRDTVYLHSWNKNTTSIQNYCTSCYYTCIKENYTFSSQQLLNQMCCWQGPQGFSHLKPWSQLCLLQNVREMMRPVSYLSEKLSKTLKSFENTRSGFSFKEKHHRVKWEADDTWDPCFWSWRYNSSQNSSIYIFVYRAKLQHVNTFSGIAALACDGMTLKNKFYVRKKHCHLSRAHT